MRHMSGSGQKYREAIKHICNMENMHFPPNLGINGILRLSSLRVDHLTSPTSLLQLENAN